MILTHHRGLTLMKYKYSGWFLRLCQKVIANNKIFIIGWSSIWMVSVIKYSISIYPYKPDLFITNCISLLHINIIKIETTIFFQKESAVSLVRFSIGIFFILNISSQQSCNRFWLIQKKFFIPHVYNCWSKSS